MGKGENFLKLIQSLQESADGDPDPVSLARAIRTRFGGDDGLADELVKLYRAATPPQQVSLMRQILDLFTTSGKMGTMADPIRALDDQGLKDLAGAAAAAAAELAPDEDEAGDEIDTELADDETAPEIADPDAQADAAGAD